MGGVIDGTQKGQATRRRTVDSHYKCATFSSTKDFVWGLEVEALVGSTIQLFDNKCKIVVSDFIQVAAFWKVERSL
jgi:hypothetical protein